MFFYSGASGDLTGLLFVGPVVAVLLGMSIYTDVSYDSTAFSLHLQTEVSGRDDRWGRVLAFSVPAPGDNPFTSRPGLLIIGVRWGGKLMDKRGPELLVQLQRQK